jgi:hypothetical protein
MLVGRLSGRWPVDNKSLDLAISFSVFLRWKMGFTWGGEWEQKGAVLCEISTMRVDARNSVRIGSSRAAVTGHDFPKSQSNGVKARAVKAGRRQARSQNIRAIRPHFLPP